jgi:hypothetical protein
MSEFLAVDLKGDGPESTTFTMKQSAARHAGQLEADEDSPQARAWRQQAQAVRVETDRAWIARRLLERA